MCGIVGYVGDSNCVEKILKGLRHLEYRGYDSAGIAVAEKNSVKIIKKCGKLEELINHIQTVEKPKGHCGIGHTRWATNGKPNDLNSHPHQQNKVTIVHNGIIENSEELKEKLKSKYSFKTETDTEVLAALIDSYYTNDPVLAIKKALKNVKGSYALGILFNDIKDTIFGVRKDSPLIVGFGKKENFLASDIPAIIDHTKKYVVLDENEIAVLKKDSVNFMNFNGNFLKKEVLKINWDVELAEKNGFSHFMLKEIFEQPQAIKRCFKKRLLKNDIDLKIENLTDEKIKSINKIHIVACGTAMHAGLVGKHIIEKMLRIPVEVEIASEFRYKDPILHKDDLIILISQSGETADTLAALNLAKERKIFTLAIVNVVGSSIARQADSVLYTLAGPEIAVATTKAFTAQMAALYLLTLKFAKIMNKLEKTEFEDYCKQLNQIPNVISKVLKLNEPILKYAKFFYKNHNVFFIGRGVDRYISLEASLKLKEISYINSEAYAAGELKHGTIALIENKTPVLAIATQTDLFSKTINNVKEVIARGADVLLFCDETAKIDQSIFKFVIKLPKTSDLFTPLYAIIPIQLFCYHVAVLKGCDVDKPRNLAKSVTVE